MLKMDIFNKNRIFPDLFQIEDVESDNACFYRSVANCLGLRTNNNSVDEIMASFDFSKVRDGGWEKFYRDPNWGYSGETQDTLARNLQELAYHWVQENHSKVIKWDFSDKSNESANQSETKPLEINVKTLISLTHDIDYEEYLDNYRYFAGDLAIHPDGEEMCLIPDRWGGFVEQVALSHLFEIPIVVLTAQRYDEKTTKIITGRISHNKAYKGVMFKTFQISGQEYLKSQSPIYLLWKKTKTGPHYMALYPKDTDQTLRIIQDYLNNS
jgi:hypothetical protein